ncbi:hypothetical protein [Streptomyces sp. NPDC054834]
MPSNSKIDAAMYLAALAAGLVLMLSGKATAVETSGYIAPFLVIFERGKKDTLEK